jgi:hypothetical protein
MLNMKNETQPTSVAAQQKSEITETVPDRPHENLSSHELHNATLHARDEAHNRCIKAQEHIAKILLPYCEEVIERYKMQGVAAKDRPNGKPTVEGYFKSIDLNYNTVRSWIRRKKLETAMFELPKKAQKNGANPSKKPPGKETSTTLVGNELVGIDLEPALDAVIDSASLLQIDVSPATTLTALAPAEQENLADSPEAAIQMAKELELSDKKSAQDSTASALSELIPEGFIALNPAFGFEQYVRVSLHNIEKRSDQERIPLKEELGLLMVLPETWDSEKADRSVHLLEQSHALFALEAKLLRRRLRRLDDHIKFIKEKIDDVKDGVKPLLGLAERPEELLCEMPEKHGKGK